MAKDFKGNLLPLEGQGHAAVLMVHDQGRVSASQLFKHLAYRSRRDLQHLSNLAGAG